MPGGNDLTYNLLKKSLDASSLRQRVISHNISNINTKNYKSFRVSFEKELEKALDTREVKLKASRDKHIGIDKSLNNLKASVKKDNKTSMRQDGNNVDIDLEMSNLAANQILYNALVQQTNKKISTLRYVISEGRR